METGFFPDLAGGASPEETRIQELRIEPWPDGKRIRVHAQLTPFSQRPNVDLIVLDSLGQEVASTSLIETMLARFVVTLHLRPTDPNGDYRLLARLYYPDLTASHELNQDFHVSAQDGSTEG